MSSTENSSLILSANISSVLDISNYTELEIDLGPKRDPLAWVIPVTIVYIVILITGLVGNFCTCLVIIRNRHMHTATNYYLFSLAVSDLLLLVIGLPQELYLLWNKFPYVFGEAFCVIRGFASEMSTNASILTILSFTSERYVAICYPLKTRTFSKLSRAVHVIIFIWIISGMSAIPFAYQFGIVYEKYKDQVVEETAQCMMKHPIMHAFATSTIVFFIVPMVVMSVLYILIGLRLRECSNLSSNVGTVSIENGESCNGNGKSSTIKRIHLTKLLKRHSTRSIRGTGSSSRKAVIKMLFAVVVAFFICWAPFHAQRLLATYAEHPTPTLVVIYTTLTHISGVTYYISATINPILYSIMSNKFRQAFKNSLAHSCMKTGRYNSESSHYSTTNCYYNSAGSRSISMYNNSSRKKKTLERIHPFGQREWQSVPLRNGIHHDSTTDMEQTKELR